MSISDLITLSLIPMMAMYVLYAGRSVSTLVTATAALLIVGLSCEALKRVVAHVFKNKNIDDMRWLYRPNASGKCSFFNRATIPTGSEIPAFPSTHMTIATFIVVSLIIKMRKSDNKIWLVVIGLSYLVAMAYSRKTKLCHNDLQIVAGIAFGAGAASLLDVVGT